MSRIWLSNMLKSTSIDLSIAFLGRVRVRRALRVMAKRSCYTTLQDWHQSRRDSNKGMCPRIMTSEWTAKVLAKCMLNYYSLS